MRDFLADDVRQDPRHIGVTQQIRAQDEEFPIRRRGGRQGMKSRGGDVVGGTERKSTPSGRGVDLPFVPDGGEVLLFGEILWREEGCPPFASVHGGS
jgi:hypothetical protein